MTVELESCEGSCEAHLLAWFLASEMLADGVSSMVTSVEVSGKLVGDAVVWMECVVVGSSLGHDLVCLSMWSERVSSTDVAVDFPYVVEADTHGNHK